MAFPAAPTEFNGALIHFGTTDGNAAAGWFAVDTGVTGTGGNTVGFLAIATHAEDDPAGTPGGLATSSVPLVLVGATRDDALSALTPIEGDVVRLRVDANGALWTHDDVLEAALSGSELQVDVITMPTVAVTNAGLTELAAAINSSRMDANIAASIALDVSAATVTVDLGANNDVLADGSVAHDALDSGGLGPVKIGGRAQASEAQPEEVADNDRVDALFDRSGYLRVRGDFDPQFADINDASSGNNTIVAAQAAGKRIAVWSIMLVADGTVDVRWEDGAAGTAFTGQVPLQAREGYTWSAGGIVPLFVGSAATLLNLELSAAVAVHGSVSFTVMDD